MPVITLPRSGKTPAGPAPALPTAHNAEAMLPLLSAARLATDAAYCALDAAAAAHAAAGTDTTGGALFHARRVAHEARGYEAGLRAAIAALRRA